MRLSELSVMLPPTGEEWYCRCVCRNMYITSNVRTFCEGGGGGISLGSYNLKRLCEGKTLL